MMNDALTASIDSLTEAGQLRRLSGAFARFIGSLGSASPALRLACVVLAELEGRGHSCVILAQLAGDPVALLGWSDEQWRAFSDAAAAAGTVLPRSASAWCAQLSVSQQVWRVGDLDFQQPLVLDGERLYLRRYWRDEMLVAGAISVRARSTREIDGAEVRKWLDILFETAPDAAGPDWQKIACAIALRSSIAIITGGPGTGKTYTVARLLALLFALADDATRLRVALAAPTGKAAARLKQSIDSALAGLAHKVGAALPLADLTARMGAARTLHSLLGARPDTRALLHHAGNRLDVDVVIVDEASMVHLEMMAALLVALPPNAVLILLGDKDQLASVEAGAVLGDLCHEAEAGRYLPETVAYVQAATGQAIPASYLGHGGLLAQQTVMLRASRRFGGPIGALALAVNDGRADAALECLRPNADSTLAWIEPAHQSDILQLAVTGRAGAGGGYRHYLTLLAQPAPDGHEAWVRSILRSFESFRILCALREGEWGVTGLNAAIEQRLEAAGLIRRRSEWYVGRPVMITRNDYGTNVFNGDIGLTLADPARAGSLRVYFLEGDAVRSVLATRLRQVETAFAMTVHKAQGSEFRHTVLVLPKERASMIARELIYTGITRAREFFTLVAPARAVLQDAIGRRTQRASGLRARLDA